MKLRRARNLKPCHEIRTGWDTWRRVVSVTPLDYDATRVRVAVTDPGCASGRFELVYAKNSPVPSRRAET